jgi:hypothetical protein
MDKACARGAAAERQRIRRRRQAGIVLSPFMDSASPAPRGGRGALVVRLAKQLASQLFPEVTLTAPELEALVDAVKAGATSRHTLECLAGDRPPGDWIGEVSAATRIELAHLLARAPLAPPVRPAPPEVKEVQEVAIDAGLVLDPQTGAWVRRR